MFDLFGRERKELRNIISDLEQDIANRKITIDVLKRLNKEQLEQIAFDSDVWFDFSKINIFSIARVCVDKTNNKLVTNLGYLLPDGTIGEWIFTCSLKQHEELVKHFHAGKPVKEIRAS